MRWKDIVAESDIADKARKRAEKAVKARKKIADAERKKSRAEQTYQDALRSAAPRRFSMEISPANSALMRIMERWL